MASAGLDRALRILQMLTLIPALAFLIAHGAITQSPFPAVALIPMGFSSIFGFIVIVRQHYERLRQTVMIDLFIGCFLTGMTVPAIIVVRESHYGWGHCYHCTGETMIGSYGTIFLLINTCIHIYFVVTSTSIWFQFCRLFSSPQCPHCNGGLVFNWQLPGSTSSSSANSKEYVRVALKDDEVEGRPSTSKEPRPSTEDESARLV